MSAVWVVRDALSDIQAAFPTEKAAVNYTHKWVGDGLLTLTRETLLTPEMSAVLEAAKAWHAAPRFGVRAASVVLFAAIRTLREKEGA